MDERTHWLDDLELFTEPGRREIAARHAQKAMAAASKGDHTGERWHAGRHKGQRERFSRVRDCGSARVTIRCGGCHGVHRIDQSRCQQHRVCASCRGVRAYRYRQRFKSARKRALRAYRAEIRGDTGRPWREAFLTLTYPKTGDPARDVQALYEAWPRFIRRLRNYITRETGATGEEKERVMSSPWARVAEITPGNDDNGHAHFHAWVILPFVHHSILRAFWARSLDEEAQARVPFRDVRQVLADAPPRDHADIRRASMVRAGGKVRGEIPWPVVDIRACKGDPGAELVKYLIKDRHHGEQVDAAIFARLFLAIEGRRVTITSRYFWTREVCAAHCRDCGTVADWSIEVELHSFDTRKIKPPVRAGPRRAPIAAAV